MKRIADLSNLPVLTMPSTEISFPEAGNLQPPSSSALWPAFSSFCPVSPFLPDFSHSLLSGQIGDAVQSIGRSARCQIKCQVCDETVRDRKWTAREESRSAQVPNDDPPNNFENVNLPLWKVCIFSKVAWVRTFRSLHNIVSCFVEITLVSGCEYGLHIILSCGKIASRHNISTDLWQSLRHAHTSTYVSKNSSPCGCDIHTCLRGFLGPGRADIARWCEILQGFLPSP